MILFWLKYLVKILVKVYIFEEIKQNIYYFVI